MTRTQGRRREIAVRAALGARQHAAAAAVPCRKPYAEPGWGRASGFGYHLGRPSHLADLSGEDVPNGDTIHIDASVCIYVLAASCISALIFGILPALQAARLPILTGLREDSAGSGSSRGQVAMRDTIVTVEVALSLLLLVAAGVMAHTLYAMQRRPLGFNPDKVLTAELMLPQKNYWFVQAGPSAGKNVVTSLIEPMLDRIRQLPGVTRGRCHNGPASENELDISRRNRICRPAQT